MTDSPNIQEGALIDGRYRILERIAEGGMATVFTAKDERLGRTVAIKVMHMQLAQGPQREQFVERFRREATSAASIANPHIVQVYDFGEFNGLDYLVMEYVRGSNLRQDMQRQHTYSVRDTLRIIGEVLDGLASAHRAGVVHRDIKPENIMLNERGRVQITDFGLAKAISQATLSSTGMLLGTAAYLAPEMISDNQAIAQGDCYSVGIIAWEMLTGSVPFKADNPVTLVFKHVNSDVPPVSSVCTGIAPAVSDFVSYLTARSVDARPADADQALLRLHELMNSLSADQLAYRYDPTATKTSSLIGFDGLAQSQFVHNDLPADATQVLPPTSTSDQPTKADTSSIPPTTAVPQQNGDDAPTVAMALPLAEESENETQSKAKKNGKKGKKKGLIIGLIIALVLVLGGVGGATYYMLMGPGSYNTLPKPDGLNCPSDGACKITGVSWKQYKKQLDAAEIPYTVTEEYSDTVPAGDIISTNPANVDGRVSKKGGSVKVIVSKGIRQATVPADIMDANSASGKNPVEALKKAGFTNITEAEAQYSMDVPEGAAISVIPGPGTTVNHNDQVTVTLSKGRMPVTMPDVVGKQRDQAQAALGAVKLNASYEEKYSDKVPAGEVMEQSVPANTQLHWGDDVHIVVSKGPEMVTMPDVTGKKTDEARKILEGLGLQVKVTAPVGDFLHTVRFQSPKAGEQVRLHGEDGKPTVVTLTVI
ncbi:serine/threonine protein kinase [Bifidobacterium dolichotidis]|uniref:non-specific serine/threonine protein kinase n=1 Tax=Bifidobacterium dolichotidis TaxID=2306976 RepID=A0A430FSH1_9BIFI|nr:Stk1 family PASTA domain-containing Ser/Thr kinase [Bifidobacterium dolichotidis]RSX55777.1 serine/threonine protein kinase [Bifidobacterium dolichotidis]